MNVSELKKFWNGLLISPHEALLAHPVVVAMSSENLGGFQEGWLMGEVNEEIILADPEMAQYLVHGEMLSVSVYAINMIPGNESIGEEHIHRLPEDARVAVTPLLNGCVVGISRDGRAMFHKRPPPGQERFGFQEDIKNEYGDQYRCLGAKDYVSSGDASVIGINTGGWKFYLQLISVDENAVKRVVGLKKVGFGSSGCNFNY